MEEQNLKFRPGDRIVWWDGWDHWPGVVTTVKANGEVTIKLDKSGTYVAHSDDLKLQ